jgi:DNA-binding NtrC family response regulator
MSSHMSARAGGELKGILAVVKETEAATVRHAAARAGVRAELAHGLAAGVARVVEGWDAVLLSLSVDHADTATAARIAEQPGVDVLLVSTATPTLELTVDARDAGAAAVLAEPLDIDMLVEALSRALDKGHGTPIHPGPASPGTRLLGASPGITRVFDLIARVADTPATVLVTGESGTGKELVARALHDAGGRRTGPFVAVNCAAIPEHLLESELFGHERGAFTGAVAQKAGRFERASGGTIFLDEIGDMSLVLQAKILRALEEREVERLGGTAPVPVDVRVVAATHRALPDRIAEGEFREDLYYRLAVIRIELPPLRDRAEDVEPLALHFAATFAHTYGRRLRWISLDALRRIRAYTWPGNVRELRNVIDRAVLLCRGSTLSSDDLLLGEDAPRGSPREPVEEGGYSPTLSLSDVEARHIRSVIRHTGGHLGEAARVLGIHRNTLTRKVQEYGIDAAEART